MKSPLESLLVNINKRAASRVFFSLPQMTFLEMRQFKTFRMNAGMPVFILFKYRQPLVGTSITTDPRKSADLTLGKMHYLYSGGILFGYLFEFPVVPFKIFNNFCTVNSPDFSPAMIKNVDPIVTNQHLTVYGCSDVSVVMIANTIQYIDAKR